MQYDLKNVEQQRTEILDKKKEVTKELDLKKADMKSK